MIFKNNSELFNVYRNDDKKNNEEEKDWTIK